MSGWARTALAVALAAVTLVLIADAALAAPHHPELVYLSRTSAADVDKFKSVAFPPTRVLAIGDSVLLGAGPDLVADLAGREVVVDAAVSRSTGAGARAAAAHGTDWDVVILFLGHNDGATAGVYQPPYRALLDRFAAVPRVVVVTIHEIRPYYPGVNAFLRAEAARRPNVRVADWNAAIGPGMTAADGLHLTSSGRAALGQLLADQVADAELDFLPTTTVPPTTTSTTTTPTTTVPVSVIPPASLDRPAGDRRASTTTTRPATTHPAATDPTAASAPSDDAAGGESGDPPASASTPWGVWVALALGALAMAVILARSLDPPGRPRT